MSFKKKELYKSIMEQVAVIVKKKLQESYLNEESLEDTKNKTVSDVYYYLNNFVEYNRQAKRNEVDAFTGKITKLEHAILDKYSSRDKEDAKKILAYLKKNPAAVDQLISKDSYFYFANKQIMNKGRQNVDKFLAPVFKKWLAVNDTEEEAQKAQARKENKDFTDNLFMNDFRDKDVNWGVPKSQDPKKFAFGAYQNHYKYMTEEDRKKSDELAKELGYSSWKEAFVNYGINIDGFILKYVQGEQGGGKKAAEYANKGW